MPNYFVISEEIRKERMRNKAGLSAEKGRLLGLGGDMLACRHQNISGWRICSISDGVCSRT